MAFPLHDFSKVRSIYHKGRVKRKHAFGHAQKCADSDHPVHAQSIIRAFVRH